MKNASSADYHNNDNDNDNGASMSQSNPTSPALDFDHFHRIELPRRLTGGFNTLALAAAKNLPPICFQLAGNGHCYSYQVTETGIEIQSGRHASTLININQDDWQGLVNDLESAPGLLYGGRLDGSDGDLMQFVEWEPALRAMFHGRPAYDPSKPLVDQHEKNLDPGSRFSLADSPDDMRAFLNAAGFLVIRDVFTEQEITSFRQQARQLHQAAEEGDKTSWWGKNKHKQSVLCRVIHAGTLDTFKSLYQDPRILSLQQLLPNNLGPRNPQDIDGVTVIYKNPDMVEGLSDLPWHRDCGMGGHAVMCPMVICSIYLYPANDHTGPLKFLPGSHHCTVGFADASDTNAPSGISAELHAGDVSLHFSDVMHAAPAPKGQDGPYRESVLICFDRTDFTHHRGDRHYNDALLDNDDGQVENLRDIVHHDSRNP